MSFIYTVSNLYDLEMERGGLDGRRVSCVDTPSLNSV